MFICKYCEKEFLNKKSLLAHYGKCSKRTCVINSILTKEFLIEEYEIKNKTSNIIATELNDLFDLEITAGTIIKKLLKFRNKNKNNVRNIYTRTKK